MASDGRGGVSPEEVKKRNLPGCHNRGGEPSCGRIRDRIPLTDGVSNRAESLEFLRFNPPNLAAARRRLRTMRGVRRISLEIDRWSSRGRIPAQS